MYTIILAANGTICCQGRLQDGTERWTEPDLETAVKSMKQFAKTMNGMKIKRKNIVFLKEVPVTDNKLVKWDV